jgi:multidrug resistance efflux pump
MKMARRAICSPVAFVTAASMSTLRRPSTIRQSGEVRGARLTWERYAEEVNSKKEELKIAQIQRKSAATIVQMHEIRSPVSGTIRAVLYKRGEGVKVLETVFLIELAAAK